MKIGLISLGCPKNLVDSEVMLGLAQRGRARADARRRAAPTCSSSTPARSSTRPSRSRSTPSSRWRSTRRTGACQRLIVTGCLAERYRDELQQPRSPRSTPCSAPARSRTSSAAIGGAADAVGSLAAHVLPQRRSERGTRNPERGTEHPAPCTRHVEPARVVRPTSTTPRRRACWPRRGTTRTSRSPKGCDYKCAFCIIPTLRGAYRSRPADSIVARGARRSRRAASRNCCSSRRTRPSTASTAASAARSARLLRELNTVDGLEWIRLLYLYPTTIDDDMLAAMAECDKVCKYIDLPLQHASNPVLEADEAPGHAPEVRPPARPHPRRGCPASRCARRSSSASPARPTADVDELVRVRRGPRVRPRRRLHLLARGGDLGVRPGRRRAGPRRRRRAGAGSWRCRSGSSGAGSGRGSASASACWSTGRRPTTISCCRAGWRPRRRTSMPWST